MIMSGIRISEALLRKVQKKYHYNEEDRELLRRVAEEMERAMEGQSVCRWQRMEPEGQGRMLEAVMTLGKGLDALQEEYLEKDALLEAYMVETIGGELLLECYRDFNREVADRTGLHVARYHFFGGEEALALEEIGGVLERLHLPEVSCNQAFCLTPKLSVVFRAALTEDPGQVCEGICAGCGNRSCPNRMEEGNTEKERYFRWPDLPGIVLPYGYMRILGLDRK